MRGNLNLMANLAALVLGMTRVGSETPGTGEGDPDQYTETLTLVSRRNVIGLVGAGIAGLAAAVAGVPIIRAFFATPPTREHIWHVVGDLDDFPVDETVKVEFSDPDALPWAGPAARSAAWLRRTGESDFTAFSIYCTHTGCPVSWRSGANLFICPCHGGVFDREGDVVAGPPEEPLGRLEVRIRDQQVELLAAPVPLTGKPEPR